jgi:hypothetical protein
MVSAAAHVALSQHHARQHDPQLLFSLNAASVQGQRDAQPPWKRGCMHCSVASARPAKQSSG